MVNIFDSKKQILLFICYSSWWLRFSASKMYRSFIVAINQTKLCGPSGFFFFLFFIFCFTFVFFQFQDRWRSTAVDGIIIAGTVVSVVLVVVVVVVNTQQTFGSSSDLQISSSTISRSQGSNFLSVSYFFLRKRREEK